MEQARAVLREPKKLGIITEKREPPPCEEVCVCARVFAIPTTKIPPRYQRFSLWVRLHRRPAESKLPVSPPFKELESDPRAIGWFD